MSRLPVVLLLVACTQSHEFVPTDDTAEGDVDTDSDSDSDTDTDTDTDTDEDGDGFTVEEGDCDDNDISVNPARDEDPDDGKDNDCDGRLDEEWAGLSVARQYIWGNSEIVLIDTVSRITDTIELEDGFAPVHVSHGVDGGWVFIHDPDPSTDPDYEEDLYETSALVEVDEDGNCTILAEFELDETEESYEAGLAGLDDFPVIRGLVTHPDGYYIVARRGELVRVDTDGSTTSLAEWNYDWGDKKLPYELFAMGLAYDLLTGEVAIYDFLGGFATWSEDGGLTLLKQADLADNWKNWDYMITKSGDALDAGGWYGMLVNYKTGEYAVYEWDDDAGDWSTYWEWSEEFIYPEILVSNGDTTDFFVTANAGWFHTIWQLRATTGVMDDFYYSGKAEGYFFRGAVSNY